MKPARHPVCWWVEQLPRSLFVLKEDLPYESGVDWRAKLPQ